MVSVSAVGTGIIGACAASAEQRNFLGAFCLLADAVEMSLSAYLPPAEVELDLLSPLCLTNLMPHGKTPAT